jgi:rhodanese-related sulfurtransferase
MLRTHRFALAAALLSILFATTALAAEKPADEKKQTKTGLYVTAKEAYEQWSANKDGVKIIDCRTPEEYVFVGHAPMAHNIPSRFMSYDFNAEKKEYVMKPNEGFVAAVQGKFKPEDVLMVMCRSGQRSAESVNRLAEAGFAKVYTIIDGFEGDMDKDQQSPTFGRRAINGWQNAKLPVTYALDPALIYQAKP